SSAILIDVTPATAPSFYGYPSNAGFTVGDTINLSTGASGTEPLTYEWKKGTTVVGSGTTNYYSKANAQVEDGGTYTITVTNVAGSATTPTFTVTVGPKTPPSFYSGPNNTTVQTGDYISLWAYD